MITYREFSPTEFDRAGAFLDDEQQDWLVSSVSRTRDSGILDQSNFACTLKALEECGEDFEVHRFSHWGPGWFEIIIARPGTVAANTLQSIEDSLADYPILDENDHSEREWNAAADYWKSMRVSDRVRLIQECRDRFGKRYANESGAPSIFAARRDDIPEDSSGYIYERLTRDIN